MTIAGDVANGLQTKLGPLPAWGWGVAAAGVLIVGMRLRDRQRLAAADAADAAGVDGFPDPDELAPAPGSFFPPSPAPELDDDEDEPPQTDEQWIAAASAWLISERNFDPIIVTQALRRWLDGGEVTEAQANVIREAIRRFGSPPQGAPDIRIKHPPGPPPTTDPKRPLPPSSVNARSLGREALMISWNPSRTAGVHYTVERSVVGSGRWQQIADTDRHSLRYPTTTYQQRFRVRARNRAGFSGYALSPIITHGRRPAPDRPRQRPPARRPRARR